MPTLRPNATVSNGYTVTGPATAHEALDEAVTQPTAPDTATDHISTSTVGAVAEVALADYALGAGESVTETRLWVYLGAGAKRGHRVSLRHGATILATADFPTETGWQSVASTTVLTQAQIDDLRAHLECYSTAGGGGQGTITVYATYIDLAVVAVYDKTGSGVSTFVASGVVARQDLVKAGMAVMGQAGAATFVKEGTAISLLTATGVDALETIETGTAPSPRSASGVGTIGSFHVKAGIAAMGNISGGATFTKAGSGVSARSASGVKGTEFDKLNAAAGGLVKPLYGLFALAFAQGFEASGGAILGTTYEKTGTVQSTLVVSGTDSFTTVEVGSGQATFTVNGDGILTVAKAGSATTIFSVSGSDTLTTTETGSGVVSFSASGFPLLTMNRKGQAESQFIAVGADAVTTSDTASGVTAFAVSGVDAFTTSDSGLVQITSIGSGNDALISQESSTAASSFSASGISQLNATGTIYTKSGIAVSTFSVTGLKTMEMSRIGHSISQFVGMGIDSFTHTETSTVSSTWTSSGELMMYYEENGIGVSSRVVSGLDTFVAARTGQGTISFIASGIKSDASEVPTPTGILTLQLIDAQSSSSLQDAQTALVVPDTSSGISIPQTDSRADILDNTSVLAIGENTSRLAVVSDESRIVFVDTTSSTILSRSR